MADERRVDVSERERIARALIAVVGEHGCEEATVEMVLARAGVEREAFERHFADIQECIDRVWEDLANDFAAQLRGAFAGSGPWRDRLRAAAHLCFRYFTEDEERARFFVIGVLQAGLVAQARRDVLMQVGIEIVDAGRQELEDPESMSRTMAEAAVGSIYAALVEAIQHGGGAEVLAPLTCELMYIAVLPYLGQDAATEELEMPLPTLRP